VCVCVCARKEFLTGFLAPNPGNNGKLELVRKGKELVVNYQSASYQSSDGDLEYKLYATSYAYKSFSYVISLK